MSLTDSEAWNVRCTPPRPPSPRSDARARRPARLHYAAQPGPSGHMLPVIPPPGPCAVAPSASQPASLSCPSHPSVTIPEIRRMHRGMPRRANGAALQHADAAVCRQLMAGRYPLRGDQGGCAIETPHAGSFVVRMLFQRV
ncbi:hypothetical protein HYPSUDRAFT_202019 [Hypholoma sublateritium FD-334 SS-4]|uniref:Uncharacterized protein n=1 Tax=Hypholoma sublateritium (strain FD-334 SS-4) TaxID=945553 RepID=A0A0D2MGH4_HYPSF|nr:hypothetical protein HYPSUDRAFT_202019 [Hypholoma sublateritium FD-334 SS-4]